MRTARSAVSQHCSSSGPDVRRKILGASAANRYLKTEENNGSSDANSLVNPEWGDKPLISILYSLGW